MPIDPTTLTVTELVDGLRAGARGSYPREAAVELLIRHWTCDATSIWCSRRSHAGGSHDHVHHVGEPVPGDPTGEWRITNTSPRLRPGPLHAWPEPALPGLTHHAQNGDAC